MILLSFLADFARCAAQQTKKSTLILGKYAPVTVVGVTLLVVFAVFVAVSFILLGSKLKKVLTSCSGSCSCSSCSCSSCSCCSCCSSSSSSSSKKKHKHGGAYPAGQPYPAQPYPAQPYPGQPVDPNYQQPYPQGQYPPGTYPTTY